MNNILIGKKHIHFIGIGGSGMYPLAQILFAKGYYLTGSDNNETDTLDAIRKLGIKVFLGQRAENIEGADLIVHTAAIMSDNPELIAAKKSGAVVLERSELLGMVTTWYENAICVSGTHGKTTTSSMITQIMVEANKDISAVIGGKLDCINGSGIAGNSDTMVCEACEFVDTFLKLSPDISVILNIDEDHLDYFKTLDNIITSFAKFSSLTTKAIIVNGDDENSKKAVARSFSNEGKPYGEGKDILTFGLNKDNDCFAVIKEQNGIHTKFDVYFQSEFLGEFILYVPGVHNVLNATAAILTSIYCDVDVEDMQRGLKKFCGAKRRFEKLAVIDGITICDDYAHHPAEVKVTLEAAKFMDYKRIVAVHQPFTYSRTFAHLDEFANVLSIADKVVLTEIMGSREVNTYNIFSSDLADKIYDSVWFSTFEETCDFVCDFAQEGDLVITLGCGDVNKVAKMICEKLGNK